MVFGVDDALMATAVAGIGSGVLQNLGAQDANRAAAQSADKQMQFQERMSDTAYQRSVTDMRAAGLNPALMFGSGSAASTPGGAAFTPENTMKDAANALSNTAQAAAKYTLDKKSVDSTTGLQDSQSDKTDAETDLVNANVDKVKEETRTQKKLTNKAEADAFVARYGMSAQTAQAMKEFKERNVTPKDTANSILDWFRNSAQYFGTGRSGGK